MVDMTGCQRARDSSICLSAASRLGRLVEFWSAEMNEGIIATRVFSSADELLAAFLEDCPYKPSIPQSMSHTFIHLCIGSENARS